jgi:hypothetical protein
MVHIPVKVHTLVRSALALLIVGPVVVLIRLFRFFGRLFVRYGFILFLCLLGVGLFWFLLFFPHWQVSRELGESVLEIPRLQIENQVRGTWAQILGGGFVLAGLVFAWLRIETSRRAQITDRYIRAIDQLGSDNTVVRLGAIYGLERIANESSHEHWAVVDVLSAFIRHMSPGSDEAGGSTSETVRGDRCNSRRACSSK